MPQDFSVVGPFEGYGLHSPRRAEKLILAVNRGSFVSGHDFSRADKANRMTWALAPGG